MTPIALRFDLSTTNTSDSSSPTEDYSFSEDAKSQLVRTGPEVLL